MTSLLLRITLILLMIDSAIEVAFISNTVSYLHQSRGNQYPFDLGNGTSAIINAKPARLLLNEVFSALSSLLTLSALAYTFAITSQTKGQIIDTAIATQFQGRAYPQDQWTPEVWTKALLALPISSILLGNLSITIMVLKLNPSLLQLSAIETLVEDDEMKTPTESGDEEEKFWRFKPFHHTNLRPAHTIGILETRTKTATPPPPLLRSSHHSARHTKKIFGVASPFETKSNPILIHHQGIEIRLKCISAEAGAGHISNLGRAKRNRGLPTGREEALLQIPALVLAEEGHSSRQRHGITLVVSPLVALIRDQTDAIVRHGTKATKFESTKSAQNTSRLAR
ncbi:hypothetical protein G7Y89_g13614 [Cudoniella acicularis]|uniref:Uncharacterized protein n=1 Tax=Cudoniella acicularis TaxID=354080 RepID=A0A8H4VY25_9HELO|nr:hypothetical protein G7Y89_g13614 [Cudoniella acicularis]